MKRRDLFWLTAGILIGSIYLSEQSQFGDKMVELFGAGRAAIATMLDRAGEGSRDIGQTVAE